MTVAERTSALPMQRPRLRPVPREDIRSLTVRERVREWLLDWIADVSACRWLLVVAGILTAIALCMDYYCGAYVTATKGAKVPDLILDRFQAIDMGFLFVYGYMALIVTMFLYPAFFRVRTLHIVAIQFSLLLMLRSVFMLFTHMETPAGAISVGFPTFFEKLYFENDMFFSGHTAMPFLGFYLFRHSPLRYLFFVGGIVMGIVVLAMHLHYSIDVFGAFFMTYCSYRMGQRLLRRLDPTYLG
ncbi:MAG TPA: hypothetical protein PKH24_06720 [Sedimentisphaerales bacterium]|jgi:hypothetical protein|nr:hypothetical protein [Sedimentisphaerales bacterium]HNU28415.1 hypothetical protein [Sedimentisphaerales bacterium]